MGGRKALSEGPRITKGLEPIPRQPNPGTSHIGPCHGYLLHLTAKLLGNIEDLHIEGESIEFGFRKDRLGGIMTEEFAAALGVREAGESTKAQSHIEGLAREASHQRLADHDCALWQATATEDAIQFAT